MWTKQLRISLLPEMVESYSVCYSIFKGNKLADF